MPFPTTTTDASNTDDTRGTQPTSLTIPHDFTPQSDASPNAMANNSAYYASTTNNNIPPTPESAVFNSNFIPNSNIMADLTSWGQFDSLVTAGFGMFDGSAGWQGETDFGNGFGFGM